MALNLAKIQDNRAKAKEEKSRRSANFFSMQNGRNNIRILPPWEGSDDFSRPMGKHWNLGPEGKQSAFCLKQCAALPCPICEEIDKIWKTKPDDTTKEWLKNVSASQRYYINLIDLNDKEKGVQIGELPKTVLEEIWNIMVDEDTGLGDITHWDKGFDLIIEKTGLGLSTRYSVRAKRAPSKIERHLYEEGMVNLEAFVRTESYTDLRLLWEGKLPTETTALPEHIGPMTAKAAPEPKIIDVVSTDVTDLVDSGLPACFGGFNETLAKCLDCPEQDDCEEKMEAERGAANEAEAAASLTKKATEVAPPVTTAPAPATATPESMDEIQSDLMAEMERAIKS